MAELRVHPSVIIGDAKLGHQKCCYHELYVLTDHERFVQGQRVYVDFFPPETKGSMFRGTHWFGEKTPLYSANRLVPFRAMATFGPGLKLFLTWRKPTEMFSSRYLQLVRKEVLHNETFAQWAKGVMSTYNQFADCRQEHLNRLGLSERVIYSDSDFSVPATASLEEHLGKLCKQVDNGGPLAALEGLGMFRRWAFVFGKRQILCILLEDQTPARMDWVFDRLAKHLGIDRAGFASDRFRSSQGHAIPNASFDKLRKQQTQLGTEVVQEMWNTIKEIRALGRDNLSIEDRSLFFQLCKQ